jgi:cell volume regulation protein A
MSTQDIIRTLAITLGAGLVSELLASALRLPRMLVLLGAGALLGPYVAGWLELPLDSIGIQLLLTLGVSFILFNGGLGLSVHVLQKVAIGLGLLAIPGVVITAVITGAAAAWAFGLPFQEGLLIGAVLASTDPAILIPLFERLPIRRKVVQTIIAESAFNDVTGAVLSLTLAAFVLEGGGSFTSPTYEFVRDLAISTALGIMFGVLLAIVISNRRLGIWREFPAVASLLVVTTGFFSIDSAGGSGYLGAFLAGLIVANMDVLGLGMHSEHEDQLRSFVDIVADIVVIFVFISLGANLPFDQFPEYALPALATLVVFIFVARPITVIVSLGPDRRGEWSLREIAFMAWVRETGVVPAAVAGLLVAKGISIGDQLVTTVALAIVVTLLLQSTTKPWLARRLDLFEPEVDASMLVSSSVGAEVDASRSP